MRPADPPEHHSFLSTQCRWSLWRAPGSGLGTKSEMTSKYYFLWITALDRHEPVPMGICRELWSRWAITDLQHPALWQYLSLYRYIPSARVPMVFGRCTGRESSVIIGRNVEKTVRTTASGPTIKSNETENRMCLGDTGAATAGHLSSFAVCAQTICGLIDSAIDKESHSFNK